MASTDGVGAERNFYSEFDPEGKSDGLDDIITDYETSFAEVLEQIRSYGEGDVVDPALASEVVVHLTTRNDHFRQATTAAAEAGLAELRDQITNPARLKRLIEIQSHRENSPIRNAIDEKIDEYTHLRASLGMTKEQFRTFFVAYLMENFDEFHKEIGPESAKALTMMIEQISEVAADAQKKALTKHLLPDLRIQELLSYQWTLTPTNESLILPDCVAVAQEKNGRFLPLTLASKNEISRLLMPLSSNQMLLGRTNENVSWKFDAKYMNRHLARCSWDFFVTKLACRNGTKNHSQIRKSCTKYIDELVAGLS